MLQATSRRNQCPEYPARSSLSRRFCGIHHVRLHHLMPSQIEKLEAHASHFLDAFIRLTERYSLLDPMLFDSEVPKSRGSGAQARGFLTLRHSPFLSCAQDIAKLTLDSDKRTPSIKWAGMKTAIRAMRELVEALGLLIRNAGFAWESLDEQLGKASVAFWSETKSAT